MVTSGLVEKNKVRTKESSNLRAKRENSLQLSDRIKRMSVFEKGKREREKKLRKAMKKGGQASEKSFKLWKSMFPNVYNAFH